MTASNLPERTGVVTFKGKPVTLVGPALSVGDKAPDFALKDNSLSTVTIREALAGGTRAALLIVVPSIDTSVCSLETVKFNRQVKGLPSDKVATYTISVDLPFAQKRWCEAEHVANIALLSDYSAHEFGPSYGVWIKELALHARSVFLVDKTGTLRYVHVVPEVAQEPDYDEVLSAVRSLI
jgi:thiol peroxidase